MTELMVVSSAGEKQQSGICEIDTAAVVFREDLYPRIEHSPSTVQKYAADLDVLPPIDVNQHHELIDGWHRWTAHKKESREKICVNITPTKSDAHLLELAIESNSKHGLQLSQQDKQDMAVRIYNGTPMQERKAKKAALPKLLSVGQTTVNGWLQRTDKDAKAKRNRDMFALYMACHTQEEIAERLGCTQQTISDSFTGFCSIADFGKSAQAAADHVTDFTPPIYNIWKQQDKTNTVGHFGNSEQRWLDNLLYLYTSPLDIVVDPFGGGGSTIDVCKKRFRRYFVSDRLPIVEREAEIRKHDIGGGPLKCAWKDVKLVYLDPPYWKQAAGQYSDDAADLANMTLEDFNSALSRLIKQYASKLTDAHIALIIQPTQWKAENRQFTDHVGDMLRAIKLPVAMRYSVPYESQQCNAQMVNWAKDNKQCLVLTREIIVWKVAAS